VKEMINLKALLNTFLFRKIFKSFTIYTGANFINQAIPFLLLPILTRFLSPYDYGLVATFQAMLAITVLIIGMGMTDAVVRAHFDKKRIDFNFPQYISNAFFIIFVLFILLCTASFFLKDFISIRLKFPSVWILLVPVVGIFITIPNILLKLWVFQQQPMAYSLFNLSRLVVEFSLTCLLIIGFGLSWKGRIISVTITRLLFLILGMYFITKSGFLVYSINFDYIRQILRYSCPIFLHSLGVVVIGSIDRFFLNTMVNVSETGIYSASYSICSLILYFSASLNLAINPIIYRKLNNITEEEKKKIVKFTYIAFIFILIGVSLFVLIAPFFIKLMLGKKFLGAVRYVFWLSLGFGFHAMYNGVAKYIFYSKKTFVLGIISLITVFLSILFDYNMVKLNGALGIAQATCFVFLLRFLLVWYFSNKVYPMPWFYTLKPLLRSLWYNK
jgi:O-antigen/teichoic acid export membrane protein